MRTSVYVRNAIFGIEDGLVSTVGFLSGIVSAGVSRSTVLLTGLVLIFVEGFSMGIGSMLSEHSGAEYEARSEVPMKRSVRAGLIMFVSYFFAGLIPFFPYVVFSGPQALWISVSLSLAALFILGLISGVISRTKVFKEGVQMFTIGGLAVALGVIVGQFLK